MESHDLPRPEEKWHTEKKKKEYLRQNNDNQNYKSVTAAEQNYGLIKGAEKKKKKIKNAKIKKGEKRSNLVRVVQFQVRESGSPRIGLDGGVSRGGGMSHDA